MVDLHEFAHFLVTMTPGQMFCGPSGLYGHDHFPHIAEKDFDAFHFGFLLILYCAIQSCIVFAGYLCCDAQSLVVSTDFWSVITDRTEFSLG